MTTNTLGDPAFYPDGTLMLICADCCMVSTASEGLRGLLIKYLIECRQAGHKAALYKVGQSWRAT